MFVKKIIMKVINIYLLFNVSKGGKCYQISINHWQQFMLYTVQTQLKTKIRQEHSKWY